ncbi:MAG: C1 family peptidase [Pseudomonadota bacterium]
MIRTKGQGRGLGWLPDVPDQRDHVYSTPVVHLAKLPVSTDLRAKLPPVYDQGELGSCTANALGAAIQFERRKQKLKPDFIPSRLFIYYNERVMEHTVGSDAGAQIRDGIKTVAKQGNCPERDWPYVISKFTEKPGKECYRAAVKYKAVQYQRVPQVLNQMKGCLASGFPFVFGFSVYTAFEDEQVAKNGVLDMPGPKEKLLGGHAVLAVGYDDRVQRFIVRNSWGSKWGMKGYFTMPYTYLLDSGLADDFWTIRLVAA